MMARNSTPSTLGMMARNRTPTTLRVAGLLLGTGMIAWLLALLVWTAPALAAAPPGGWQSGIAADHALVGQIWSVREEKFVEFDDLRRSLAVTRFVLLGETHDNPDHHRLQAQAVEAMVAAGRKPAVVWEMLTSDQAPALASYLARPDADAAGLGPAVGWTDSGWPDWALYRPVAEVALAAGLAMAAGNAGAAEKRAVLREGLVVLPPERRAELALVDWQQALQDDLLADLVDSHCGLMDREKMAPLAAVQRLRDAVMADALLRADTGDGAVLIAGAGHVREDRGVPWYLRSRGKVPRVLSVVFREVRDGEADPSAYAEAADFVWFTPQFDDRDHCAGLREHLQKRRGG